MTVYAKNDSPFKTVTVNGQSNNEWSQIYSSKKKIKFKVSAASGYKLKKLEIGTYKQTKDENGNVSSALSFKAAKSKKSASFTLSTKPYAYTYSYGEGSGSQNMSQNWSENMAAPTVVRITYTDKWTKLEDTATYWFYYIK